MILTVSACKEESAPAKLDVEGAFCLPYSPEGQVVYDSEWTGIYPTIEAYDKSYKTMTVGMGCFWGPAAEFAVVEGVLRTRVGYAGGQTTTPSYEHLGNHIEVFEIDYDPEVITYQELVELYFTLYDATVRPHSLRVKSVIFYRNEEEEKTANEVKQRLEAKTDKGIFTEIDPLDVFYLAEGKHQLSYLKLETSLYSEIKEIFPEEDRLLLSILASKINGFIAGYGSEEALNSVLNQSGLSEASINRMNEIVKK